MARPNEKHDAEPVYGISPLQSALRILLGPALQIPPHFLQTQCRARQIGSENDQIRRRKTNLAEMLKRPGLRHFPEVFE
jgi:hypothetical protein